MFAHHRLLHERRLFGRLDSQRQDMKLRRTLQHTLRETTKKLGRIRRQSTWRTLPTYVVSGTPCTSNTTSSPSFNCKSRASPCSNDIGIRSTLSSTYPVK